MPPSSPSRMKILSISGNVFKSFFILILIALSLSVFGVFDINSKAKDEIRLRDPRVIAIKAAEEKIKRNIKKPISKHYTYSHIFPALNLCVWKLIYRVINYLELSIES